MVSSIGSSKATNLYEINNSYKTINNSKSKFADIEDCIDVNPTNINPFSLNSKEELFKCPLTNRVNSLDDFISICKQTNNLGNSDYKSLYQEYMHSRGCNSQEELDALNAFSREFCCPISKDFMFGLAKGDIKGTAKSLEYCSEISISDEQISSLLSNASIQNIGKYMTTSSTTVADGVFKFQTLLNDVCNQNNVSDSLKSSLSSLSKNISDASDLINKWSDQVNAENNVFRENNHQSPKYNASLIANYQKY